MTSPAHFLKRGKETTDREIQGNVIPPQYGRQGKQGFGVHLGKEVFFPGSSVDVWCQFKLMLRPSLFGGQALLLAAFFLSQLYSPL